LKKGRPSIRVKYKGYGFWKSIDTFKDVEDAEKLPKGSSYFERA